MKISLVPTEAIWQVWNEVEEFIGRAARFSHGRWSAEAVFEALCAGNLNLWIAFEDGLPVTGVCVTRVAQYPGRRMLAVDFCGGNALKTWRDDMLQVLEKFALNQFCDGLELTGRRGWEKELATQGWHTSMVVVEKNLSGNKPDPA